MIDAGTVAAGLERVRDRIADAGGDPGAVAVVAVTKGFGAEAPLAALGAGLADLGENYAQELLEKAAAVDDAGAPAPRWHFIGRLQSNKVRLLADRIACWQSIDRPSLVDELARRAPGARLLVQVDAAGEEGKGGAALQDVPDLVARARDAGLQVTGLMAVGVAGDEAATEGAFARTAALADRLGLPERSLGMSGDLAAAVRAGTTMVRVGTALFGPRPGPGHSQRARPPVRD
ncbi:MAG TPA: YggS family pyridoxal phosphate-dependent enzyme [Acidimicrobiales bacterium]|nr:YggS family pyridoxal phosphate-dependent enzyme [Acidimicrobiales bacterium]